MGHGVLKISPKINRSILVKSKDPRIAGINHSEWKIKTRSCRTSVKPAISRCARSKKKKKKNTRGEKEENAESPLPLPSFRAKTWPRSGDRELIADQTLRRS